MVSYNTRPFIYDDFELMCKTFKALEFNVVELHLGHFIEGDVNVDYAKDLLTKYELSINIVDGGWCDLARNQVATIPHQIELAQQLDCNKIRLFFTPLTISEMDEEGLTFIYDNLSVLSTSFPDIDFLFETHKGIGIELSEISSLMLATPDNIGLVFDPVNIIVDGHASPAEFLYELNPYIKHVHLKGAHIFKKGTNCVYDAFGEGTIDIQDLTLEIVQLIDSIGIEYEGKLNPVLGLLRSKENFDSLISEFRST